jgi:hypothetical protein
MKVLMITDSASFMLLLLLLHIINSILCRSQQVLRPPLTYVPQLPREAKLIEFIAYLEGSVTFFAGYQCVRV